MNTLAKYFSATHDEHSDEREIIAIKFQNALIARVEKEPKSPVPMLYTELKLETIAKLTSEMSNESAILLMPTYNNIRSMVYRARNKLIPTNPTEAEQISLTPEMTTIKRGQTTLNFLIADRVEQYDELIEAPADRLIIFGTDECLKIACETEDLLMDGTFRISPSQFEQLYVIHAMYEGVAIPVMYAFLTDRTTATYRRMLELIKSEAGERGHVFAPKVWQFTCIFKQVQKHRGRKIAHAE